MYIYIAVYPKNLWMQHYAVLSVPYLLLFKSGRGWTNFLKKS